MAYLIPKSFHATTLKKLESVLFLLLFCQAIHRRLCRSMVFTASLAWEGLISKVFHYQTFFPVASFEYLWLLQAEDLIEIKGDFCAALSKASRLMKLCRAEDQNFFQRQPHPH